MSCILCGEPRLNATENQAKCIEKLSEDSEKWMVAGRLRNKNLNNEQFGGEFLGFVCFLPHLPAWTEKQPKSQSGGSSTESKSSKRGSLFLVWGVRNGALYSTERMGKILWFPPSLPSFLLSSLLSFLSYWRSQEIQSLKPAGWWLGRDSSSGQAGT